MQATAFFAGGISANGVTGTLKNCTIASNHADHSDSFGGALIGGNNLTLINTIIANNGAGIYWGSTSPTIYNNLVAFNSAGMVQWGSSPPTLRCNNVFGNTVTGLPTDYYGLANATGNNGNISAEPRLANYKIGNFRLQPAPLMS